MMTMEEKIAFVRAKMEDATDGPNMRKNVHYAIVGFLSEEILDAIIAGPFEDFTPELPPEEPNP